MLDVSGFVETLVARHPQVETLYAAHLREHGVLFPEVLMGDVAHWYIEECARGGSPEAKQLVDDLHALKSRGDDHVALLICRSFLEKLDSKRGGVTFHLLNDWMKVSYDMVHGHL